MNERGGEWAEYNFEDAMLVRGNRFFEYGLSNPLWSDGEAVEGALPLITSGAPDYIMELDGRLVFVDPKGGKRANSGLQWRLRDHEHLQAYAEFHGMDVYIFVSDTKNWYLVPLSGLVTYVENNGEPTPINSERPNELRWWVPWYVIEGLAIDEGQCLVSLKETLRRKAIAERLKREAVERRQREWR